MARLNLDRESSVSSLYGARSTVAPSPGLSTEASNSDKENQDQEAPVSKPVTATRPRAMDPPLSRSTLSDAHSNKRRRVTDDARAARSASVMSACPVQTLNTQFGAQEAKTESHKYYDPDQNMEYRQGLRIAIRKNHQRMNDNRDDLLKGNNDQLISRLRREDRLMDEVRQTSDAVLDSKFMLGVAELSSKKLADEARGKNSRGLDLEEFISKCIAFMKNDGAPIGEQGALRSSRVSERTYQESENDADDDGDALKWNLLGEHAAFPSIRRPPTSSFLLGVLSVEKKVRNTQASARQRRDPISALKRPEELQAEDLDKDDKTNTTNVCNVIRDQLTLTSAKLVQIVSEKDHDDMTEAQKLSLFRENHLSDNWEMSLFEYAINPKSFAQSVENLFYISFLIKDGHIKLSFDGDGLPTIRALDGREKSARASSSTSDRHQAIFSLDYHSWRKLIKAFNITVSMIPDRQEAQEQLGASGWYT